jgi:hypothetical protein
MRNQPELRAVDVEKALVWLKQGGQNYYTYTAKEILPGTHFGECWCCQAPVGIIHARQKRSSFITIYHVNGSVPTCFEGVLTCQNCEQKFKRQPPLKIKPRSDLTYQKFLQGKLYPEIKVTHTRLRGAKTKPRGIKAVIIEPGRAIATTNVRLTNRTFFLE